MKNKGLYFGIVLYALHAALLIAAAIISLTSSNRAYAVTGINNLVAAGIGAAVVDVIAIVCFVKGFEIVTDILTWISIVLSMMLMCGMITGRLKLMGYVWFSDLESGNPVAVGALNLTVVAWICVAVGVTCLCVKGFKQEKR